MKICATQSVDVEISKQEQKKICLNYIYELFEWDPDWMLEVECGITYIFLNQRGVSMHLRGYYDRVREATENDAIIYSLINKIKKS